MKIFFRALVAIAVMLTMPFAFASAQIDKTPNLVTTVPLLWGTDRYQPCGFSIAPGVVHGSTGVLQATVCSADDAANRSPAYSDPFYNTQGEQTAIDGVGVTPPASQSLSLDLFVDQNFSSSANGLVSTGLWARVNQVNSDLELNAWYPIVGFSNTSGIGAFRFFDGNLGYQQLAAPVLYDTWNTLSLVLTGNVFQAYVNGTLEYTETADPGTDRLSTAFVNTSEFGDTGAPDHGNYTADWRNTTATPEPGSLALFATGLFGIGGFIRQRRRAA